MADSTRMAHEIIEYLVQPKHLEKHLMLRNIKEEGHTTEGPQVVARYHFVATACYKGLFLTRRIPVQMSYVHDPQSPEAVWSIQTPQTNFFSKAIRVTELERNGRTVLQVTCDVVVEYKLILLARFAGVKNKMEREHMNLLLAMKDEMEARNPTKSNVKKI